MGGAEVCLETLINSLSKLDIKIYVLTPNYRAFKEEFEKKGNITIHRFKSLRYFLYKQRDKTQKAYKKNRPLFYLLLNQYIKFSAFELAKKLESIAKTNKFSIVHSNNIESLIALSSAKVDAKKIAHIRDCTTFCLGFKTIGNKFCSECNPKNISKCLNAGSVLSSLIYSDIIKRRRRKFNKIDYFFFINNFVKETLIKEKLVKKEQSLVVHDPLNFKVISKLSKEKAKKKLGIKANKVALFVGSLTYIKGAQFLPELIKRLEDVHFVVVGDGPLCSKINRIKAKNLTYKKYIDNRKISDYYKAADVFLYPVTIHPGWGLTATEALANSTPIIAFDTKGVREGIPKGCGALVKLNDINAFSSKVEEFAKKGTRSNQCKKISKKIRELHNPDKIAKGMLDIYKKVSK